MSSGGPSSSLVVPMVMWGPQAPTHCISALYLMRDQKTLVTGAADGQVILWEVETNSESNWNLTPRHLLIGHTAPVKCIAKANAGSESHYAVTSSENGEMFIWDTVDGRCIENKQIPGLIHTSIQAYRSAESPVRLFCCGFYEEIVVMDPLTLTTVFSLSSRTNSDWVSAFHVLRPRNRNDDVVLALTTTGTVKVWTLTGEEQINSKEPILENESKFIRCVNAVSMNCCVYNMRTVLIVCNTFWCIFDAGDFTCLLSVKCQRGERWVGGEFISAERIVVYSDDGKAYLYKLPTNCIVESKEFQNRSKTQSGGGRMALLFCELVMDLPRPPLHCPPTFKYLIFSREGKWMKYLMRGDANGRIALWKIPDTPECASMQLKKESGEPVQSLKPCLTTSLEEIWAALDPAPPGVLNQFDTPETGSPLTATIFLPMQCRLVCGREDGSIILVPATQTIMLHMLSGRHQKFPNWPQHQILLGHSGRVNCLLYPHNEHPRYDVAHLVSGSVDFSVCLWDIYTGQCLHRFCAHAGEITNLYVPPASCSPRIQHCICSVASDHSVTLLSLKERRTVLLASRHMFPVQTIKWRPLDDFLVVGCTDGTTSIWQMETGHLDRIVQGHNAEEILTACDEHTISVNVGDAVGSNAALHFFRGLRHRNLAAIKLAAQSGISQIQGKQGPVDQIQDKSRAFPLVINGFRTNPKDAEGHLLFFDVEALVIQLLTEEYSQMSPNTMEVQGFTNQREYDKIWALTKPASPDTTRKITGFLNMVKDRADEKFTNVTSTASPETQRKLTGIMSKVKEGADKAKHEMEVAKKEIEKRAGAYDNMANGSDKDPNSIGRPASLHLEINLTLEIGQVLLSLLHAWGLDKDLDKVAISKLGLLKPKAPVSYGLMSKGGIMSLMLPTWKMKKNENVDFFTALGHWELSHSTTTNHLLSVIAITNTLVSVSNASFIPEQERRRKLVRQATHGAMDISGQDQGFSHIQEQIKKGWSLLSTLHCLLLSGKLRHLGSNAFKKPNVEQLAIRWQDRCLQIRLAAQELLVAELKNLGPKGRKHLVEVWGAYLPKFGDPPFQSPSNLNNGHEDTHSHHDAEDDLDELDDEDDDSNDDVLRHRRNQTTAVILLGVIGALFDLEAEGKGPSEQALGDSMTRPTAKALMYLVLTSSKSSNTNSMSHVNPHGASNSSNASSVSTPTSTTSAATLTKNPPPAAKSALRRAAIDLIGRGFVLWEPHLEVSKVLLGLLEMCCEADWWVPSAKYGLPLTAAGDSCRTSRLALTSIARVRPAVFITSISKEIARYNNLAANAQALNINVNHHVLARSKAEILHLVELLIDNNRGELVDLLVDVVDIILHCIDQNHLKSRTLYEVFHPTGLFPQISHCIQTRRIAVGTKSGHLAMYELRGTNKTQMINAHQGRITAVAFSQDGKNLASFSGQDNKLYFWQTSTSMFGLGNAQTKCTRSYNVAPHPQASHWNAMYAPKLVWISPKTVTLLMPDGTENRFNA